MLDYPSTIPAAVSRAVLQFSDREAVVDRGRRVTYTELGTDTERAAASLLALGMDPGDRVSIWSPNSYEWIVMALAVGTVGATLVPVNTRFRGEEAADVIGRTRARILMVSNGFLDTDYVGMLQQQTKGGDAATRKSPIPGLPHVERVIDLGSAIGPLSWESFLNDGLGVTASDVRQAARAVQADDVLDILFTSGTTGRPKGAMSSHRQTIAVALAWIERAAVTSADRYLVVNPFFHSFGYKAGFIVCLLSGATAIPMQVFDLDAALDIVAKERISILPGPPTVYFSLLDHPDRATHDLSSLRLAVTGATVVPVPLIQRMQTELSFTSVLTGYGLSEAVVVTMCHPGDDPQIISHSSGTAAAGFEVAIVDAEGNPVSAGTPGEIIVRGPNVMLGYFEEPDATADAIDADGWLRTGDVGHLDERGYLTITDRIKDMYTVGGFNVYPAEVEQVVMRLEDVLECAVVAMSDERLGEVGVAFVVPRLGRQLDEATIVAYCRSRLANYKVPRRIRVVEHLPRNAAGKVLKTTLRQLVTFGNS